MRITTSKIKKFLLISAIAILLIVFTACHNNSNSDNDRKPDFISALEATPLVFESALTAAYERRQNIVKPDNDLLLSMTQGRVPEPMPPYLFDSQQHTTTSINLALEDANLFFEVLRNNYGGYLYFGGDEVFFAVRDNVISEILSHNDTISPRNFEQLLVNHLSPVIHDAHFNVGNNFFGRSLYFYHSNNLTYEKTEKGFRNIVNGLHLEKIEGWDIENAMNLHINSTGELFYRPVILSDILLSDPILFTYEGEVLELYSFHRESNLRNKPNALPTLEFINGIPIVTLRLFGFDGHENAWGAEHAKPFISFVDELINEPIVIVDLRSNNGGNGGLPVRWLYYLTNEMLSTTFVGLRAIEYNPEDYTFDPDSIYQDVPNASLNYLWAMESFGDGYTLMHNRPRHIIERENILIVLTDRFSSSAAELFVDLTMSMTNALIVGSSTSGSLTFDRFYPNLYLPNSGINFGFGSSINLWPEDHFAEGVGLLPDIWVTGDALTAVLALLQNAGIGSQ